MWHIVRRCHHEALDPILLPPTTVSRSERHSDGKYVISRPTSQKISLSNLETTVEKLAPNKAAGPIKMWDLVLKKSYNERQHYCLLLALLQVNLDFTREILRYVWGTRGMRG